MDYKKTILNPDILIPIYIFLGCGCVYFFWDSNQGFFHSVMTFIFAPIMLIGTLFCLLIWIFYLYYIINKFIKYLKIKGKDFFCRL